MIFIKLFRWGVADERKNHSHMRGMFLKKLYNYEEYSIKRESIAYEIL